MNPSLVAASQFCTRGSGMEPSAFRSNDRRCPGHMALATPEPAAGVEEATNRRVASDVLTAGTTGATNSNVEDCNWATMFWKIAEVSTSLGVEKKAMRPAPPVSSAVSSTAEGFRVIRRLSVCLSPGLLPPTPGRTRAELSAAGFEVAYEK